MKRLLAIFGALFVALAANAITSPDYTNSRVLYVDTNATLSAVKGVKGRPYSSLTNAIANAVAGDTLQLTPGQTFDCGINALTLSNLTVVAYGATLTVSNGPNILFTVTGPMNWYGGVFRDLGVATDASAIMFPFQVTGTTAFTNNFYNLIIRSRTDALNIGAGSAAFAPTINIFGCDWEDMWDLFTCSSPQTHRCKINAVGSRFAAIASLHTGSFGAGASIASAGTGYDFVFTGCDLICSNSTATCYGLLCDVNSTFTLSGTSCAFDTTAADSQQLYSGDNYAITVDGHPFPDSYIVAGSGLIRWKGDATNAFVTGGVISSRSNGDRYWTAPVPNTTNFTIYAAGTAYTLTGSSAALTFGTTQPVLTINQAGTYLIQGNVGIKYSGATYAGAQTCTLKFRRTNNTAADLTSGSRAVEMPVLTTFTGGDVFSMPPVIYTATSGDTVTIFGILSATPSAGSVQTDSAEIVAIRLY